METPPLRGLTLSLSWHASPRKRELSVAIGPALRAAAIAALCALSYQFGVWRASLETQAQATSAAIAPLRPLNEVAIAERAGPESAPGQPAGEPPDVITPLNVRDPAALVMGPSDDAQQPAARQSVPRRRVYP